jgi:dTDP-4-dehydrorhamnose reductase
MRVIVFGSTGMVGRAVAARLRVLPDIEHVCVSRATHNLDVARDTNVERLIQEAELAINCIGVLRGDPSYPTPAFQYAATTVNSLWPQELALQTADANCRVIHLSTDAVFAPAPDPANELTPLSPYEPYGLSKALGEVDADHVINLRFSVIGPAPDRQPSLWEWLVRQPREAVIKGHSTVGWTGCTSIQLASLISDLIAPDAFHLVRSAGPCHHFVPNGAATKFAVLQMLAERLRPDISIVPVSEEIASTRPLESIVGACEHVYTGIHGWTGALDQMIAERDIT